MRNFVLPSVYTFVRPVVKETNSQQALPFRDGRSQDRSLQGLKPEYASPLPLKRRGLRRAKALLCQQVLTSLDARLSDIERRIADLQAVRDTLERIRSVAAARPQPQECDDQCVCHLLTKGNAMLTNNTVKNEVTIACNPNAIPTAMREQWVATGKEVYAAVEEVQDMPDGYRFRLPPDSAMLLKVAEYITHERLCCAFIRFTVEIEPNNGPLWLRLTGGEGAKEYMKLVFEEHDLLGEQVARAAGLRQA